MQPAPAQPAAGLSAERLPTIAADQQTSAAVAAALEQAAQLCDRWAAHCWDNFRDQALAVKQRADEIRSLISQPARAALEKQQASVARTMASNRTQKAQERRFGSNLTHCPSAKGREKGG